MEKYMKRYAIAITFSAYAAVNPAYAVEPVPFSSTNAISAQAGTVSKTNSVSDGEKTGQSDQEEVGGMTKSRAQIYQELVVAEQDGSQKRLDNTVYRGR
jgi:hypothetical protein